MVCHFENFLTVWKSFGNSSDLDKLAVTNTALISWFAENLMKLNEEQLIDTVSVIHSIVMGHKKGNTEIYC